MTQLYKISEQATVVYTNSNEKKIVSSGGAGAEQNGKRHQGIFWVIEEICILYYISEDKYNCQIHLAKHLRLCELYYM